MCGTCGCGQHDEPVRILKPGEEDQHRHSYTHEHEHLHGGERHAHAHHHDYMHSHTGWHHHHDHDHAHQHDHHRDHHHHDHGHGRQIDIEADALQKNNLTAERNRGYFEAKNILALNLVSSPGSGKTSLLEKTIESLKEKTGIYVIEGDQQTMNDANRIQKAGAPVVQVNTGSGCHLDADMVNRAVKNLR